MVSSGVKKKKRQHEAMEMLNLTLDLEILGFVPSTHLDLTVV